MLVRATRLCIQQLEERLNMQVSRGEKWRTPAGIESQAVASSQGARGLLTTGMRAMGVPVKNQTRNLGVDNAPGRRARRKVVLLTRWQKVRTKAKRSKRMGKVAATLVEGLPFIPAITYGSACVGFPSALLRSRAYVANLPRPNEGMVEGCLGEERFPRLH